MGAVAARVRAPTRAARGPRFDLPEVLRYAADNGIGYIAHNETRGDIDYYDQYLEKIFSRYEELGIHAIG
ncbi:hypothetical protein ABZ260_19965 [Streptosporangium sp. NPDC006013]|uniref:hypothetical protein n=1 Tax=Streptosporangium sp. NPDC006013 TaxID=3155596 RepID=UPI0033B3380B